VSKSLTIGVRCTPEQKKLIEQAAESERRSLSNYVLNAVFDRIKQADQANTKDIARVNPDPHQPGKSSILETTQHNF